MRFAILCIALGGLAACASAPPPTSTQAAASVGDPGLTTTTTEQAPAPPESVLRALDAVEPVRDTPRIPPPRSLTVAGGCGIPCGTSSVQHGLWLAETSDDPTYGYSEDNPIRVQGIGGYEEMRYLQGLYGPDGQLVTFERIGSCCRSPPLDAISVWYEGLGDPVVLFLDPYNSGRLLAPVGFRGVGARPQPETARAAP